MLCFFMQQTEPSLVSKVHLSNLRFAYPKLVAHILVQTTEKGGARMLNTDEIRNKEVINIYDGKSMGFVCDIEINLQEGRIDGIVLPGDRGFMKLFGKESNDFVIKWKHVKTIGEDVILVDVPPIID